MHAMVISLELDFTFIPGISRPSFESQIALEWGQLIKRLGDANMKAQSMMAAGVAVLLGALLMLIGSNMKFSWGPNASLPPQQQPYRACLGINFHENQAVLLFL